MTSNTAVSATMVPIAISLARESGNDPVLAAVACGLAASLAFMLPVATPPNAIVYGSGEVRMQDMIRAGLFLDILGWICVTLGLFMIAGKMLGLVQI